MSRVFSSIILFLPIVAIVMSCENVDDDFVESFEDESYEELGDLYPEDVSVEVDDPISHTAFSDDTDDMDWEDEYNVSIPRAPLSSWKKSWLRLHNERRKEFHENHNKHYVALSWRDSLMKQAGAWAQKLKNQESDNCNIWHDPSNKHSGENIYVQKGGKRAPLRRKVLTAWSDNEKYDFWNGHNFADWGHFSQVMWRGTRWVGCAGRVKNSSKYGKCYFRVCRYHRPGNCNIGGKSTREVLDLMLADSSPCK